MGASGQPMVRLGSRGYEVVTLQQGLNQIGTEGTPFDPTGLFDQTTDQVVRRLLEDNGIGVDGIVGPHTWEAIDRHVATDAEVVTSGDHHHAGVGRPTAEPISAIENELNSTSTGPAGEARDWDGRNDRTKRQELEHARLEALQEPLDAATPHMEATEEAKAAGSVLSTDDQQGAGRAAKAAGAEPDRHPSLGSGSAALVGVPAPAAVTVASSLLLRIRRTTATRIVEDLAHH